MIKSFKGRVWKFGDHIDTDVIYPGKYLPLLDEAEMALHAFEGFDPGFPKLIQKGDIIAAGANFGCGSSREQAATCLKAAGISCIAAESFSRLFFRNAINQGLPLVQSGEAADLAENGDIMAVDFSKGTINIRGRELTFPPLPEFLMSILENGGLIESVKKRLQPAG
jgi:3-isopropylmalate/(R)-2-methylmalate dehydratase small subunit